MDELATMDAVAQADLVRSKEVSAVELVDAALARIEAVDPLLRSVAHLDADRARARAGAVVPGGDGPFAGVPTLLKELLADPGQPATFGSRLLRANVAAEGSAYLDRIEASGLVTLGQSTSSELGLLGSTETLLHGATHNPWSLAHSAAGSSGGSAAAVAAGLVPLAHASDGGGSVRIPASVCGLFGLKPSRGRTAPAGPAGGFFDLISEHCVSRTVRDSARFLAATEATGPDAPFAPVGEVDRPLDRRLRIATWSTTLLGAEPDPEVRLALDDAAALLDALGHHVEPIAPPAIDGPAIRDAFFGVAGIALRGLADGMAAALGRPVDRRDLEPFTLEVIDRHRSAAPGPFEAALEAASATYLGLFDQWDAILTPTLATPPWALGTLSPVLAYDTVMERTGRAVGYTPIHNIAGSPGMSVPLHVSATGLPIGSHLAAAPGAEALLLGLALQLEEARPWAGRWPPFSYPALFGGA